MHSRPQQTCPSWPDYAAVWRWHFYAGLFCLPFVVWLSITGSIYLFRPDIEAWLDRPYESLSLSGPRAAPSAEVGAALAAVPGSVFSRYEPAATATGAAQVAVARDGILYRVIVHPRTLQTMRLGRDDHRIMEVMAQLHGNLWLGRRGSMLVEVAASWAVVLLLTGLFLWFPRRASGLGGLVYPRIGGRGRLFWRDLHAVTGLWISIITLFVLLSGLPWSSNWGHYMTWARNLWTVTAGQPDWPIGGKPPPKGLPASSMPGMTAAEMQAMSPPVTPAGQSDIDLPALDKIVPLAAALDLPRPVWIQPPFPGERDWRVGSQTQNRTLRVDYNVAPDSAVPVLVRSFAGENIVDRIVNFVVATHEGQLFGRLNQAILLLNAIGLLLMSTGAVVMWWRRRPASLLGAPPAGARPRASVCLMATILALAALLPLFGLSLLSVWIVDRTLLARATFARRWLGLAQRSTP